MGLTLRVTDRLTLVKVVTLSSSVITWQTGKNKKKRKNDAVRWPEEEERKEQNRTEKKEKDLKSTHKDSGCTCQQISTYLDTFYVHISLTASVKATESVTFIPRTITL